MAAVQEVFPSETEGRREAARRDIEQDILQELTKLAERFQAKVERLKEVLTFEEIEKVRAIAGL
jgi:hypothetical protein